MYSILILPGGTFKSISFKVYFVMRLNIIWDLIKYSSSPCPGSQILFQTLLDNNIHMLCHRVGHMLLNEIQIRFQKQYLLTHESLSPPAGSYFNRIQLSPKWIISISYLKGRLSQNTKETQKPHKPSFHMPHHQEFPQFPTTYQTNCIQLSKSVTNTNNTQIRDTNELSL